jgi:hypothetical protein
MLFLNVSCYYGNYELVNNKLLESTVNSYNNWEENLWMRLMCKGKNDVISIFLYYVVPYESI